MWLEAIRQKAICSARAYGLGLINQLVTPGEALLEAALAMADKIAANGPRGTASD